MSFHYGGFSLPLPSGSAPPRRVRVTQTVYISLINLPFSSSHLSVFLSATNRPHKQKQPMIHVFLFAIHRQRSRLFHLIPPFPSYFCTHISFFFSSFFFSVCLMHISQTCAIRSTYLCSVCFLVFCNTSMVLFVPYPLRARVTHFVFTFLFFLLYATLLCTATPSGTTSV